LNKHAKIGDEIRANQDEFGSLIQLGLKMYRTEIVEVNNFVEEKRKLVTEDSFRDGIGYINAKKHQVLEGEIKANAWQLKVLNRTRQQMVQRNHFKAKEIGEDLQG